MKKEQLIVVKQNELAHSIFELTLKGELVSEMKQPGQFVHIKISDSFEPLLRRPISICSIDHSLKQFTMIYRAEGRGTQLLSKKTTGDSVDVLGPLGNGFPVEEANKGETALLVGGGIGVPPLYELSKRLVEKGVKVIHVLGFQTKEVSFYEDKFRILGDTYITTVDGTLGTKGFVTNVIEDEQIHFDILYSCGPTPMLKALENKYHGKKLFLSLEERMGCGIGACFACVCKTKDGRPGYNYKKVCSDGPVFRVGEVIL